MSSKYFFIFIFIFIRSNAFIVDKYDDAMQSYSSDVELVTLINNLKKNIVTVEFTYSNNTKQNIIGYAFENTFIVLYDFFSDKNFNHIKQIKYFYDGKQKISNEPKILKKNFNSSIVGGSEDELPANIITTDFGALFLDEGTTNKFLFKDIVESGQLNDVKKKFEINNWGTEIENYFNVLKDINIITLYSTFFEEKSWFIIGNPNSASFNSIEAVPIEYIDENIPLLSLKINNAKDKNTLMVVSGVKFEDSDLGASLIRCKKIIALRVCKFFGQIAKFYTINGMKQIIVVRLIFNRIIKTSLTFQMKPTDSSTSIHSDNKGDKLPIQVEATPSLPSSSKEILGSKSQLAGRKHKLDSPFDEKHRLSYPSLFAFYLGKYSCDWINFAGKFDLDNDIHIIVKETEKDPFIATTYDIKGIYWIGHGDYYFFNKCYKNEKNDYVIYKNPSETLKY